MTGAGAGIDASPKYRSKRVATTPAADLEIAAATACVASRSSDRPSQAWPGLGLSRTVPRRTELNGGPLEVWHGRQRTWRRRPYHCGLIRIKIPHEGESRLDLWRGVGSLSRTNPGTTVNLDEGTMKQANSAQLNRLRSYCSPRKNRHSFDPSAFNEASFSYYQRLERVWHFVEENHPKRISLADAAQVARMKPTAFSDFFRRKTGICFRDWLAAVRVNEAMEMMSANNLPVKEIALEVGYGNLRSFQRVFLRLTGQSAIEYKHSVRPS